VPSDGTSLDGTSLFGAVLTPPVCGLCPRYAAARAIVYSVEWLEGSAGKCGIVILHFEKLQKTPDTSQEFMNTMQCSILSGSMSIHTSRVVIHTKNVNPVDRAVGHTKSCH